MLSRFILPVVVALVASVLPLAAAETAFPAVAPPEAPAALGANLQRSLRLMAGSTPTQRNTVRVLFYGQSITEQAWWKTVANHLRTTFPNADLVIENRAIGGHSSQLLVKTAEADLYDFQPDLVIFHVYGSHTDYEAIIRRLRQRTVADILMATDHVTRDDALVEETDPAKLTPKSWDAWMNHAFLPATAKKYDAELADMHDRWKGYLRSNNLKASQLLKDGVHLNAHGEFVMAEVLKWYLRPELLRKNAAADDRVKELVVDRDVTIQGDRLLLEFDGNRVDAEATGTAGPIAIRIDGKKPAEHPELFRFTRASAYPQSNWPGLLRVQKGTAAAVPETWTATIRSMDDDLKQFEFDLVGSNTGADGSGSATNRFASKSGRIVIDPDDWNLAYGRKVFKRALPEAFTVTWKAEPRFVETLAAGTSPQRLFHGLPNGRHTLELSGESVRRIKKLTVYRPPLR